MVNCVSCAAVVADEIEYSCCFRRVLAAARAELEKKAGLRERYAFVLKLKQF